MIINKTAWFLRIMWACRISVISGFAGILLFWGALPAQNLLEDLSFDNSFYGGIAYWTLVYLIAIAGWALPIHYGARLTLNDNGWILSDAQRKLLNTQERVNFEESLRNDFALTIKVLPRALGLLPFFAILIGLYLNIESGRGATGLSEGARTEFQDKCLIAATIVAAAMYLAIVIVRQPIVARMKRRGFGGLLLILRVGVPIIMAVLFLGTAYVMPVTFSVNWPRALLVPTLFGALVLPLSELQRIGHRLSLPILTVMAIGAFAVTALNGSFHSLRVVKRDTTVDGRLSIGEAIARWQKANGCMANPSACPHPLVIAIDGGASRAAFAAATFVGEILDRAHAEPGQASTPGRRIFAMSGVSGGAFAAATIQAALADAQELNADALQSPCRTADRTWFGYAYRSRDNHSFSWRECLQALTSGDYLSVTITGLAFRDFVAFPHTIEDRAVLLEQAFERHYDYTTRLHQTTFAQGVVCSDTNKRGLCRHMARPREFFDQHDDGWVPLLLLNATSVQTGRRVLASDIKADTSDLFPEAFDLTEAMSSPCPISPVRAQLGTKTVSQIMTDAANSQATIRSVTQGRCGSTIPPDNDELRLSTAALTSARFPMISPEGAYIMRGTAFGDQVVDGGYFENSGLTTALEITAALKAANLQPRLLSIGNDPDPPSRNGALPRRAVTTPLEAKSDYGFLKRAFGFLGAPFSTLVATRDGHANEAQRKAEGFSDAFFYRLRVLQMPTLHNDGDPDEHDKKVCSKIWQLQDGHELKMPELSMSWWLSALVQADLDAQKCALENRKVMRELLHEIDIR